jgi:tetratricopeptide (TPR) repeat protein
MEKETSEIAKLTERISKDPKSKLFVPLAEEYKKAGDVEMAVHVLSEGLKNNPKYVTARSLLGRLLLEMGEMDAARKELEEVVNTIPDNLLAQRKLGDLYILQDRRTDALQHYKIALSLNPGDTGFAALISDVEAGTDVRPRLQPQKSKPTREAAGKLAPAAVPRPQVKAPIAPVTPVAASPAPAPPEPVRTAPAESKSPSGPSTQPAEPPVEKPPQTAERIITTADQEAASTVQEAAVTIERADSPAEGVGTSAAEETPLTAALHTETEEPEEVLVVEPIEEEHPSEVILSPGLDVLAEKAEERIPDIVAAGQTDVLTAAFETTLEFPEPPSEKEETTAGKDEKAAAASITGTIIEPSEPASERAPEEADDFTTDTLAELYISQGFYEKAISIYERMLVDHPESRGLKDKLERVRAMASQVEAPLVDVEEAAGIPEMPADADVFAEAKEYVPPTAPERTTEEITAPAGGAGNEPAIHGEAREYVPPADTANKEEEITIDAELLVEPEGPISGGKKPAEPFEDNIFAEPQEYVPLAAKEDVQQPEAPADTGAGGVFTTPSDQETSRQKPPYADFEPREYIPPSASLRESGEERIPMEAKQPGATRKETIDRLEHWLKNIKKES